MSEAELIDPAEPLCTTAKMDFCGCYATVSVEHNGQLPCSHLLSATLLISKPLISPIIENMSQKYTAVNHQTRLHSSFFSFFFFFYRNGGLDVVYNRKLAGS